MINFADGDDPEMAQASEEARASFRYFWRELAWERRRIIPALELSAVKVAFWDGGSAEPPRATGSEPAVEHMWVGDIDFDGRLVRGRLLNDPRWLRSVRAGHAVEVPLARVEDWMYAMSGRVYGGFTVNLLRRRMSRAERREHDDAWGLDFGAPEVVLVPPTKGGLFRKSTPTAPDAEHPMSENMVESLRQALVKDPGMVHEKDERGWTLLHH